VDEASGGRWPVESFAAHLLTRVGGKVRRVCYTDQQKIANKTPGDLDCIVLHHDPKYVRVSQGSGVKMVRPRRCWQRANDDGAGSC